jgi:hypothetical protein
MNFTNHSSRLDTEIVGLNAVQGMDVCARLSMLSCVSLCRHRTLRRAARHLSKQSYQLSKSTV